MMLLRLVIALLPEAPHEAVTRDSTETVPRPRLCTLFLAPCPEVEAEADRCTGLFVSTVTDCAVAPVAAPRSWRPSPPEVPQFPMDRPWQRAL